MGQQRQKILKIEDEKYLVWYPEKWFELLRIMMASGNMRFFLQMLAETPDDQLTNRVVVVTMLSNHDSNIMLLDPQVFQNPACHGT